jgi:hypothetical protein
MFLVSRNSINCILPGQIIVYDSDITTGASGMRITLLCDQPCMIYVDQSADAVNWTTQAFAAVTGVNTYTEAVIACWIRVRILNAGSVPANVNMRTDVYPASGYVQTVCPSCGVFVLDLLDHAMGCEDIEHTVVFVHTS